MFEARVRIIDEYGNVQYVRKGRMCKTAISPTKIVQQHPHGGVVVEYGKGVVFAHPKAA